MTTQRYKLWKIRQRRALRRRVRQINALPEHLNEPTLRLLARVAAAVAICAAAIVAGAIVGILSSCTLSAEPTVGRDAYGLGPDAELPLCTKVGCADEQSLLCTHAGVDSYDLRELRKAGVK